jgi:lysophospholipid acyltransferase (LPLAT)-like uncharacterized protein
MSQDNPPANAQAPGPPRRGGVVTPNQANRKQRLIAALVFGMIRTISSSLRWHVHDPEGHMLGGGRGPVIFVIWHNRLALSLVMYRRYVRRVQPQRRMAAMVSASRDGALLARILELFEVEPVRGSTSRRGPQALRELVAWAKCGFDLAITPDGPRGPRYVLQDGVIALAQLTGLPILPASYRLSWKVTAGSWDRFQIPIPGSRCDLRVGRPLIVPGNTCPEERVRLRQQLEADLRAITQD